MSRRFAPLWILVLVLALGGCGDDEDLMEFMNEFGAGMEGLGGGAPGSGAGGADPEGMASGGSGSSGDSGPPTDGWPPNAGPGPSAPPSDSFSDPDGTTYGEYDFGPGPDEAFRYRETQDEIKQGLDEGGYERQGVGPGAGRDGNAGTEYTYANAETGETVKVEYQATGEGKKILTTYIP